MTAQPSLFVSHGSPLLLVHDGPARRYLGDCGATLERPHAILMVSAHWESATPAISTALRPETIHDFYGFPEPFYRINYPAPGAPECAARAAGLLTEAGIETALDPNRGLDHGAWVPLRYMFPEADVPVAQVAIQSHLGPRHHYELGRALAPLRAEGVLIIGSGNITHNLGEMRRDEPEKPALPWVAEFSDWVFQTLERGAIDDLCAYRMRAPHAARAHPSEDHFLPLLTACGAGGENMTARRLHASCTYGALAMDVYAFD